MNESEASARIFCAIDTADISTAAKLAARLFGVTGGVKLGLEFFAANGPRGVREIAAKTRGQRLFLDLKFHDIPDTVAAAVRAATALGPYMLNVHASGGAAMLRASAEAAAEEAARAGIARPVVVGVTVLTSLDGDDLGAVGQPGAVADQVRRLAELSQSNGLDGVVCSGHEIAALRAQCGPDFRLVVPGIRPGRPGHGDHKRVMDPRGAVAAGADYLVIGRSITEAPDPAAAARRIVARMTDATVQ